MPKMVTFGELVGYNKAKMESAKAKTAERKALAKKPGPESPWMQFRAGKEVKETRLQRIKRKLEEAKAARAKLSPEEREELDRKLLAAASNGPVYYSAEELISEGANPFAKGDFGQTVVQIAFACTQNSVLRGLRQYGITWNRTEVEIKMD